MARLSILIVDDDLQFSSKLRSILDGIFEVATAESVVDFRRTFSVGKFDLIIMDVRLENDREGLVLLAEVQAQDPAQAVIVMTAYSDIATHAEALRSGALTYLDKNELPPLLLAKAVEAFVRQSRLHSKLAVLERRMDFSEPLELIATSGSLWEAVRSAGEHDEAPVLIIGEPGCGVDVIASGIHRYNRRRSAGSFVIGNCAKLSPEALRNAVFGRCYRNDSTGNFLETKGWVDEARAGTLLLGDLASVDSELQKRLAGLIDTNTFCRGDRVLEADVKVILSVVTSDSKAAPVAALRNLIERAKGVEIRVAPLRERVEDIAPLANLVLHGLYRAGRTQTRSILESALSKLESWRWPGNLQELKSAIEYAAIRADAEGARDVGPEHLPLNLIDVRFHGPDPSMNYQLHLARAELALLEYAIARAGTSKKGKLAEELQYSDRYTFSRRMRRHLNDFPIVAREFPRVVALFGTRGRR